MEDIGTWPFIVKEHQHRIFLENRPLASERVPVFEFQLCRGPLVLVVVLGALFRDEAGGQISVCACFGCVTWFWSAVSEKQFSILLNRI